MSIKFPDMQVLIGRTDQIPKVLREGDPTGAGKMASAVVQQYAEAPKKVNSSPRTARLRNQRQKRSEKENEKRKRPKPVGNQLDIKI
ncbi:MAG: hypothetical protein WAP20_00735 [Limnochordia bacterium]|jgi:hypothetical protein|nr:hypothetical protein [Bacillota bacterium]HOB08001.1 hypothetical protein [Limnochordia bacterium]NLH31607.1 hypothetical protein [Bacillota bacterium]HPT92167.1 hypothetical protein [Limnochordia bacterium]HPZ29846.1 hypothetical protein [Limnochordia bacterium]